MIQVAQRKLLSSRRLPAPQYALFTQQLVGSDLLVVGERAVGVDLRTGRTQRGHTDYEAWFIHPAFDQMPDAADSSLVIGLIDKMIAAYREIERYATYHNVWQRTDAAWTGGAGCAVLVLHDDPHALRTHYRPDYGIMQRQKVRSWQQLHHQHPARDYVSGLVLHVEHADAVLATLTLDDRVGVEMAFIIGDRVPLLD